MAEDYVEAFTRFVKENRTNIEGIQILLEQPQRWSEHALHELLEKLPAAPGQFSVEKLQKAYELRYNKPLVDLISMIKHAANEESPLYTAQERVSKAFQKVTAGKQFTEAQTHLLEKVREHLIANLSINIEDFERKPEFAQEGGWGRANHIFGHRLNELLRELNEAMAL